MKHGADLTDLLVCISHVKETLGAPLRQILRPHDLTEQQWRVLVALKNHGPAEAAELAVRAGLFGSSLSRIMENLRIRGYVEKRFHPDDQRCVYASLTQEGLDILASIAPAYQAICSAVGSSIGKRTLAQALNALNDVESNTPKRAAAGRASADAVPGNLRERPRQKRHVISAQHRPDRS